MIEEYLTERRMLCMPFGVNSYVRKNSSIDSNGILFMEAFVSYSLNAWDDIAKLV